MCPIRIEGEKTPSKWATTLSGRATICGFCLKCQQGFRRERLVDDGPLDNPFAPQPVFLTFSIVLRPGKLCGK